MSDRQPISRRQALAAAGIGAGAVVVGTRIPGMFSSSDADAATCTLTREVTEGPYWVPNKLTRRDVTDGQRGAALSLHLYVVDASTCKPIKGADVEIWHTNATGVYSDVQGNTKRFLRGHQKANSDGLVIFKTVYPGWYTGRTPHIHVKVHVGGNVVHTGQLFFPDTLSSSVYKTGVYASRGQQDVKNTGDNIYAQAGAGKAQLHMRKRGSGYVGTLTMAVNRS